MMRHRALTVIIAVVVILASASVASGANTENVPRPTRSSGVTGARRAVPPLDSPFSAQ